MKQSKQNSFHLTEEYVGALRTKFSQMSALELKKEKITMVKDLQQINQLLDEVINQEYREEPRTAEDLTRQIDKAKKTQKGLRRSLENFEFMLTGDYLVKADEQIERLTSSVKVMRQEVNRFGRMLSIPMQKDIEICEELQKQVYRIEKDVEETKIKNHKKREAIAQIREQNQKKIEGLKKIVKEIEKSHGGDDSEEILKNSPSKQEILEYQQIVAKKDKLLGIMERDQRRFSKVYKSKLKKYQQIEQTSVEIEYFLKEIQNSLMVKAQQLEIFLNSSRKKHFKSELNVGTRRKIRTQENSEIESITKQKQKRWSMVKQTRESFRDELGKGAQKGEHLLPRLYKALGKSKLQIQQDCNLRDLIYM